MNLYDKADAIRENIEASRSGDPGTRNLLGELADMVCDIAKAIPEQEVVQPFEFDFFGEVIIRRDVNALKRGDTMHGNKVEEAMPPHGGEGSRRQMLRLHGPKPFAIMTVDVESE